jgi:hypothetical protein
MSIALLNSITAFYVVFIFLVITTAAMAGRVPDNGNSWDWRDILNEPVLQPTFETRTRDAIVGKWRNIWMSRHRTELLEYGAQLIAQYGNGSTSSSATNATAGGGSSNSNCGGSSIGSSSTTSSNTAASKLMLIGRHRDDHKTTTTDIILSGTSYFGA